MAWLASDFLLELRQAVGIAAGGSAPSGLLDANLLIVADREIQTSLVPMIMSVREQFFVMKKTVSVVTGTTRVRVPARTIAGRIRDVRITVGQTQRQLIRYESEDAPRFFPVNGGGAMPAGYYVEGEWLVLLPQANLSATLDVYYFGRPGRLTVTTSDWDVISDLVPSGSYFQIQAATAALTIADGQCDIIRAKSGLSALVQNMECTAISPGIANVSSTVAAYIEAGDYVCLADKTPVVPLPVELHGVLLARTAAAVLRQLGKYAEADAETKRADVLRGDALSMLAPRVTNQPKVVVGNLFSRRRRFRGVGW